MRSVTDSLWTYHLRSSGRRAVRTERVAKPRHLIVFSRDAARLTIVRVLDDRMDISTQLA